MGFLAEFGAPRRNFAFLALVAAAPLAMLSMLVLSLSTRTSPMGPLTELVPSNTELQPRLPYPLIVAVGLDFSENSRMTTATARRTPAQRWAAGSRSRRELIAESFDSAAQTDKEALASARAMASNMRSGRPLQRAPAR